MDDVTLEHRLTTIEVTLKAGLDDIKTLGRANGEATRESAILLNTLAERVGVQNGRISKVEAGLKDTSQFITELVPKVDGLVAESGQTHAVVGFIKGAGGVGNALILTAVAVFGSILVGFQIVSYFS